MKPQVKKASLEFLSIVIAVVLAMGLTEWRQDYLNKKRAQESFDRILVEVKSNRDELRGDSANLARDLQFISKWIQQLNANEEADNFSVNFSFSFLDRSALEVARIDESLTYLPSQYVMDVSEIYATQDFYDKKGPDVFDIMGELNAFTGDNKSEEFQGLVMKFRFHMGLVYNTVRAYLLESNDFIRKYESE